MQEHDIRFDRFQVELTNPQLDHDQACRVHAALAQIHWSDAFEDFLKFNPPHVSEQDDLDRLEKVVLEFFYRISDNRFNTQIENMILGDPWYFETKRVEMSDSAQPCFILANMAKFRSERFANKGDGVNETHFLHLSQEYDLMGQKRELEIE